MNTSPPARWIAFAGSRRIASGAPREVATKVKAFADAHPDRPLLVFDARTSRPVELDLRGAVSTVLRKLPAEPAPDSISAAPAPADPTRGPGRPRLGVVAREVTLLPRHWAWLATQPGGASVVLRKLVEHAAKAGREADRLREAKEAAYRFMHATAGNEPGFEEAVRALFANDPVRLREYLVRWPRDLRTHTLALAEAAFSPQPEAGGGPNPA